MTYLLYFTAVCLSAVAAYYSIAGLVAIFAAAVIPIIVMGSVLEFAKLVVASWLYRSWKTVPILFKTYFSVALVILMMLTSMGIFGFLSKAHLDQAVPSGEVAQKVAIIDEKIKTEKDNIDAARQQLKQMDAQVDQTLSRTTDDKGAERSLQIRRGQQKERSALLAEIGSAQTRVSRLNEERAPIATELRKVEAEVGPIKYIAALIYGDNPDANVLEKAVRVVIIMIVMVFDPLAVLLLMAASTPIITRKEETHDNSEEITSSQSGEREEIDPSEEASPKQTFNAIKDRFIKRFSAKEPTMGQQATEISSSGNSDVTTDSGSETSGTSETYTPAEAEVLSWTISEPPAEDKIVERREYDSAGRVHKTHYVKQSVVDGKTIETEVEELQKQ